MDLMRARHRLSKLLLRHGIRFEDGNAWTDRHHAWLATVRLPWPAAQATLLDAQGAIDLLCHRRDQLEREIIALLPTSPWAGQVGRLRCLRGVDTLSAVGLCAEIGDFERFAKAEQLMMYIGLVPSENTTGQQRRLGSITKAGSGARQATTRRSRLALPIQPAARQGAQRPPERPTPRGDRDRVGSTTTAAPHLDQARSPRETPHDHRGRRRPRARRVRLGDHPNRVNVPGDIANPSAGSVAARHARGTRDAAMSNPPNTGRPRPTLDSGSPRRTWSCGPNPRISA